MVQLSSLNAICVQMSMETQTTWCWGNEFGFPPQFGRLDASLGHVLLIRQGPV